MLEKHYWLKFAVFFTYKLFINIIITNDNIRLTIMFMCFWTAFAHLVIAISRGGNYEFTSPRECSI